MAAPIMGGGSIASAAQKKPMAGAVNLGKPVAAPAGPTPGGTGGTQMRAGVPNTGAMLGGPAAQGSKSLGAPAAPAGGLAGMAPLAGGIRTKPPVPASPPAAGGAQPPQSLGGTPGPAAGQPPAAGGGPAGGAGGSGGGPGGGPSPGGGGPPPTTSTISGPGGSATGNLAPPAYAGIIPFPGSGGGLRPPGPAQGGLFNPNRPGQGTVSSFGGPKPPAKPGSGLSGTPTPQPQRGGGPAREVGGLTFTGTPIDVPEDPPPAAAATPAATKPFREQDYWRDDDGDGMFSWDMAGLEAARAANEQASTATDPPNPEAETTGGGVFDGDYWSDPGNYDPSSSFVPADTPGGLDPTLSPGGGAGTIGFPGAPSSGGSPMGSPGGMPPGVGYTGGGPAAGGGGSLGGSPGPSGGGYTGSSGGQGGSTSGGSMPPIASGGGSGGGTTPPMTTPPQPYTGGSGGGTAPPGPAPGGGANSPPSTIGGGIGGEGPVIPPGGGMGGPPMVYGQPQNVGNQSQGSGWSNNDGENTSASQGTSQGGSTSQGTSGSQNQSTSSSQGQSTSNSASNVLHTFDPMDAGKVLGDGPGREGVAENPYSRDQFMGQANRINATSAQAADGRRKETLARLAASGIGPNDPAAVAALNRIDAEADAQTVAQTSAADMAFRQAAGNFDQANAAQNIAQRGQDYTGRGQNQSIINALLGQSESASTGQSTNGSTAQSTGTSSSQNTSDSWNNSQNTSNSYGYNRGRSQWTNSSAPLFTY